MKLHDARREFELTNLLEAYDGIWFLAREFGKQHQYDMKIPDELGYGGAYDPSDIGRDLSVHSKAAKALRLILDDETRRLAHEAQAAMSRTGLVSIGRPGPVSRAEGEALFFKASAAVDVAMQAIAARIRRLLDPQGWEAGAR